MVTNEVERILAGGTFSTSEQMLYTIYALVGVLLIFIIVIALILLILKVIGRWKMFEKAGESGWKALIPIYNTYTQCEITGVSTSWIYIVIIVYFLAAAFNPLEILADIVILYFVAILSISTARSFGKSDGVGIGLFLLPSIFNMIIGCDDSKYLGKKPIKDIVFSTINREEVKENVKPVSKKTTTTKKAATTKKTSPKKKVTSKTTTVKKSTPAKKASSSKKTTTTKKNTTTKKTNGKKK